MIIDFILSSAPLVKEIAVFVGLFLGILALSKAVRAEYAVIKNLFPKKKIESLDLVITPNHQEVSEYSKQTRSKSNYKCKTSIKEVQLRPPEIIHKHRRLRLIVKVIFWAVTILAIVIFLVGIVLFAIAGQFVLGIIILSIVAMFAIGLPLIPFV